MLNHSFHPPLIIMMKDLRLAAQYAERELQHVQPLLVALPVHSSRCEETLFTAARTATARSSAWRRTHQRRWVTTSSWRSGPAARSSACCPRAARSASRAAYSAHLLRALLPSGLSSLCSPDAPPLAPCEKSLSGPRRAMRHADEAAPSLSAWLGVPPDKPQYRRAAERPNQLPPPPPQPPRRGRAASALLAPHPSALRCRLALGLAGLRHSRQV